MTWAPGEERLRADSRSPSGSAMITVPCASTAWLPPKRPASEAGRPAAMSTASMRRRGAHARGSVSGSAAQGMRPREGIGATAIFARCPAECGARILVRTLGLSSISLSGQSSWLADHWKTSRTPWSESAAWRVVVEVPCRACGLLAGVADGGSVRQFSWDLEDRSQAADDTTPRLGHPTVSPQVSQTPVPVGTVMKQLGHTDPVLREVSPPTDSVHSLAPARCS